MRGFQNVSFKDHFSAKILLISRRKTPNFLRSRLRHSREVFSLGWDPLAKTCARDCITMLGFENNHFYVLFSHETLCFRLKFCIFREVKLLNFSPLAYLVLA